MRVVVDRDRCEGNAICVGIAPDLFELDDDEFAVVTVDEIPAVCSSAATARRRADCAARR